jgi:hypothetical protein
VLVDVVILVVAIYSVIVSEYCCAVNVEQLE